MIPKGKKKKKEEEEEVMGHLEVGDLNGLAWILCSVVENIA